MIAGRSLPKWIEGLFRCQNLYTNHLSSCIYNYLSFILTSPEKVRSDPFLTILQTSSVKEGFREDVETEIEEEVPGDWGACQQRPLGLERQPEEGMGQRYIVKELSNADKSALVR